VYYNVHMMPISFEDFSKVELHAGTIISVEDFPEARKPAYKLTIDFGEFGIKKSSSQITVHYTKEVLMGKQVIAVINFPPKKIGPFVSEVLTTGFADADGNIVLAVPDKVVKNGEKLW
jgi:tRNA-binding protein